VSIVRVKNKYQIVIPESIRDQVGVEVGDLFEVKAERGKITFTPKSIVDRIPQAIKDIRTEAKRKGLNKITMEEIDAEVDAVRRRRQQRRSDNRRAS
jgi:AbrB family looped-hinge helix DNA binding protein